MAMRPGRVCPVFFATCRADLQVRLRAPRCEGQRPGFHGRAVGAEDPVLQVHLDDPEPLEPGSNVISITRAPGLYPTRATTGGGSGSPRSRDCVIE